MASKKKPTKKVVKRAAKKVAKKATKKAVKKAAKKPVVATPSIVDTPKPKMETIAHSTKDNITPHDKFNSMIFIIGLIAVIILLIVVSPVGNLKFGGTEYQNPEAIEGTHLLLTFDNINMKIGDTVSMAIDANNFNDLTAFEFTLGFNSDVLRYKSMTYGNFLGDGQGKICVQQKNLGNAVDNIACIKLPSTPGVPEGVDGSGNLAIVTFDVIGRGDLMLQLDDVKIINSKKESIDYQVVSPNIIVR